MFRVNNVRKLQLVCVEICIQKLYDIFVRMLQILNMDKVRFIYKICITCLCITCLSVLADKKSRTLTQPCNRCLKHVNK